MREKWFVGYRAPHLSGASHWYVAYRTRAEAEAAKPLVQEYWFRRNGVPGPKGRDLTERHTFVKRRNMSLARYGEISPERQLASQMRYESDMRRLYP
jgi:hypothetical protein